MNVETLNCLIDRYETEMPTIYNAEHNELFKWNALKTFQEEWFAPAEKYPDFLSRFTAATKDFSVFIDNSRMHPRAGVAKLYEKDPEEVARLFTDVLFAKDNGDLNLRQQNMDAFLYGMEQLRKKYYPANWSYKQDRHSASVYLAMYAPGQNYAYKYSEAETLAVYTEYGLSIGSGADFNLANYYKMCDEIVDELKEHPAVVQKHFSYLKDIHYKEESLHLLAFDLMYCSRTYYYYTGMVKHPKQETVKAAARKAAEDARMKARHETIDALNKQLTELELSLPDISDISLLNVEVTAKEYGTGTVISQDLNKITVRFQDTEKKYILDPKYTARPVFENDTEVVAAFGEYLRIQEEIREVREKLDRLS